MSWQFRPPLWSVAAVIPALALLIGLGSWQAQRGFYKTRLQSVMDQSITQAPEALSASSPAGDEQRAPHASARGTYLSSRQLLLDNQGNEGRPGYRVWTPMRLADGALLIVDRGWVAQDGDRNRLPATDVLENVRDVRGLWRPLPQPGMRFAADACAGTTWPRVVQYPTASDLRCLYRDLGAPPLDGLLLLDADQDDGFVRDWRVNASVPPQRHYAYAAQWYAFAATLLFLFVKLNLRRSPR